MALKDFLDESGIFLEYERPYKEEAAYRIHSLESLLEMAENYKKGQEDRGTGFFGKLSFQPLPF